MIGDIVLTALLATLTLTQDSKSIPPTPYDREVALEITLEDEPIEGYGPAVAYEYEVGFNGSLHVWTRSEVDLAIRVELINEGTSFEDAASGGDGVPFLSLEVEEGDFLVVLVASEGREDTGKLSLRLIACPEARATLNLVADARETLREARQLRSQGNPLAAIQLLGEVSEKVGVAPATSQAATALRLDLANTMRGLGDLRRATTIYQTALASCRRALPPNHPSLLDTRSDLGVSMNQMGDLPGSLALRESILADCERALPEDHPVLLRAQEYLAISLEQTGELDRARRLHEAAIAGYERTVPQDDYELIRARSNLGITLLQQGDLVGSRALFESNFLVSERRFGEDRWELLGARANLAIAMRQMGDLSGARELEEINLLAYERSFPGDHPDLLAAKANIASTMRKMGDLTAARAMLETVVAVRMRALSPDHPEVLLAKGNLASCLSDIGEEKSARALREEVLAGYERTLSVDHADVVRARGNLATSLFRMGDLAGARELDLSVLASRRRTCAEDHPELLSVQSNLAAVMSRMGELAEASALRETVVAGYQRIFPEHHPARLRAQASLAESRYEVGDLAGARALLSKLMTGMRGRILASLALAPRQARQTVAGESHRHSEVLFLSESAGVELERSAFQLTETMRLVSAEAARSLARFEKDPELRPILEEAAQVRRALNDLVAGAADEATGAQGLAAELTRLSLRRDRLERDASRRLALRGVVTQPVEAKRLSDALGSGDVAIGYRRVAHWDVDVATGQAGVGADHLMAHVLDADGVLNRIDLGPASELEELTGAWRAALGAPIVGHGALDAVSLSSEAETPVVDSSRGIAVRTDVDRGATEAAELDAGRVLRARILDPVLALVETDVKRLFVCADDLLFLLPLDALPLIAEGEGPRRVGDRLQVVSGVSFARLLAPLPPNDGEPSLLSMGGVDYDASGAVPEGFSGVSAPIESDAISDSGDPATRSAAGRGFQDLEQARHEAEATATLFEDVFEKAPALLTGKQTTKAALFESAPGKRYLHLATHGWFATEGVHSTEDARPVGTGFARMGIEDRVSGLAPMTLCGLALAGANNGRDSVGRVPGILTAEELCSLDLSRCELAVLSACETNVGIRRAGQGIQSLQSALYAAGARTSITSLWKVEDAATRRLMELFYTNLWKEKMGKADALWQAKATLRDEGHPPAYWAGWVLTGDPD